MYPIRPLSLSKRLKNNNHSNLLLLHGSHQQDCDPASSFFFEGSHKGTMPLPVFLYNFFNSEPVLIRSHEQSNLDSLDALIRGLFTCSVVP